MLRKARCLSGGWGSERCLFFTNIDVRNNFIPMRGSRFEIAYTCPFFTALYIFLE